MEWQSLGAKLHRIYRAQIPNVAVLFLFPVSCWSTFSGLRELMSSAASLSNLEGNLVAIALTLGIQLTLLFAVNSLTRTGSTRKPFYFGIYVITVFFSVLFGYSFYFQHLRSEEYAREIYESESQRLLVQGLQYRGQFESVARSLDSLAQYSQEQSDQESLRGGTCGDASASGRGPRTRGRALDAQIFAQYQQELDILVKVETQSFDTLSDDVKKFADDRLNQHQADLDRFYEGIQTRRQSVTNVLSEMKDYLASRFPDGSYRIEEGGTSFPCPDSRMEQLAALLQTASIPPTPPPPAQFLAHNPKVVVQHALQGLTGWLYSEDEAQPISSSGSENTIAAKVEKLPLLLGLLVDCLILLAALASHRGGGGGGLVEELHWLETSPGRVRQRFRAQLADLLGCPPNAAILGTVRLISRYHVAEHSRASSGLSSSRVVALPQTGDFLDRYPEIGRLRDLLALLESLGGARRLRMVRWSTLPGPLPASLAVLREDQRKAEKNLGDEGLDLYRLGSDVLNEMTREAYRGTDPWASGTSTAAPEEDSSGLGYDPV